MNKAILTVPMFLLVLFAGSVSVFALDSRFVISLQPGDKTYNITNIIYNITGGIPVWINGTELSLNLTYTPNVNITGYLRVENLSGCDTIDTDAAGLLVCGTDAGVTYYNASWDLGQIIQAGCNNCLVGARINEDTLSIAWANLTGVPQIGNTSLEIWAVVDNETFYKLADGMSGENITSGTVADARIASTITRDTELASANNSLIFYSDTNDTLANTTISAYARAYADIQHLLQNTTISAYARAYADLMDAAYNSSMKDYADSRDVSFNSSMKDYCDSQDTAFNNSMKSYADSQDSAYNDSMKTYADSQDIAFNTSMGGYVRGVNLTMDAYVDALNATMTALMAAMDIFYNASMKAYVDSQDTAFNTSMKTYADSKFLTNTTGWCNYANNSDLLDGEEATAFQDDIGANCSAGNYAFGVEEDGTLYCRADSGGAGSGDVHEAVYPLQNDTSKVWVNDIWINDTEESSLNTNASVWWANLNSPLAVWTQTNNTEEMQDACGVMATNGDGVNFVYSDAGATLTPSFDCSDVVGTGMSCSGEDIIPNLADAQVPDDITIASTKQINSTAGTVISQDTLRCFNVECTVYDVYNSTSGCRESHNKITGTAVALC